MDLTLTTNFLDSRDKSYDVSGFAMKIKWSVVKSTEFVCDLQIQ